MRTCLFLLLGLGVRLVAPAQAPSTPVPATLSSPGADSREHLRAEIEALLGEAEADILQGIYDPGLDVERIVIEKALDEAIKALAQGSVYAPIAEKILSLYHSLKQQRLAAELGRLRRVLRDGQERVNRLRYQSLKIKLDAQVAHRGPGDTRSADRLAAALEALPSARTSALSPLDGPGTYQILREDFDAPRGDRHYLSYEAFLTAQALADGSAARQKGVAAQAAGPATWTSPYQRMTLLRSAEHTARSQRAALGSLQTAAHAALAYGKRRRLENHLYQSQRIQPYTLHR